MASKSAALEVGFKAHGMDKWPLADSPEILLVILVAYIFFIRKWGPSVMQNRNPFELKNTILVYNFFQVIFSSFLVYMCLKVNIPVLSLFSSGCPATPTNGTEKAAYAAVYWYYIAKLTELLDTVFFVLRKSWRQITFLHVLHHAEMTVAAWVSLRHGIGYACVAGALVNALVHVPMYAYYFIAALGPEYKKYLWWKKYMTVVQLVQFVAVSLYLLMVVFMKCNANWIGMCVALGNELLFLVLFLDFFKNSYMKKKKSENE